MALTTLQTCANNVRIRLGSPSEQRPSLQQIFLAVVSCAQSLYNRAELSGQPWTVTTYLLQVVNNSSDYLIAETSSYSKPLQVLTYYPQNPSYPQRVVEFDMIGDAHYDWGLPVNIASTMYSDGSPNTAMRMSFYRIEDGSLWVNVLPQPQLSAQYKILMANGTWAQDAAITSAPVLNQFSELIEVWAAQSVLPTCQWTQDAKEDRERRKEYAMALKNDQMRVEREYELYIRNLVEQQIGARVSSLEGDWW